MAIAGRLRTLLQVLLIYCQGSSAQNRIVAEEGQPKGSVGNFGTAKPGVALAVRGI